MANLKAHEKNLTRYRELRKGGWINGPAGIKYMVGMSVCHLIEVPDDACQILLANYVELLHSRGLYVKPYFGNWAVDIDEKNHLFHASTALDACRMAVESEHFEEIEQITAKNKTGQKITADQCNRLCQALREMGLTDTAAQIQSVFADRDQLQSVVDCIVDVVARVSAPQE